MSEIKNADYSKANCFSVTFREDFDGSRFNCEHKHNEIEFDLFLKADSSLTLNGVIYKISDGSLLLIDAQDMHRFVHNPSKEYIRYVINFSEQFISGILDDLSSEDFFKIIKNGPRVVHLPPDVLFHVKRDFNNLFRLYEEYILDKKAIICVQLKISLLHILIELYIEQQGISKCMNLSPEKKLVQEIISYIDNNVSSDFDLDNISAIMFLSKYYIARIFKKNTGYSIFEYVTHKRINQAQKELYSTENSIIEIAYSCGFNNLSSFYRCFKSITGITPHKYRNNHYR